MNIHALGGCAPTPLAHYLKALGILRLLAEQADPNARGWWEGDRFRLATRLDRNELEAFFLERYEPTPFVSPWNKGSGFFYPNDPALTPLEKSKASRLSLVKKGISASRALLEELSKADYSVRKIKAEATDRSLSAAQKKDLKESPEYKKRLAEAEKEFKRFKTELLPRIRLSWRGPHLEWLDAAMILQEDGNPVFPALLGTGGNDGRLDFTNNFMQRIADVFDLSTPTCSLRPNTIEWFSSSLWGVPTKGCMSKKAVGQFLPGMAGGANSANGPTGESLLNPVDFLLMMEGTVLFTSHITRRTGIKGGSRIASPFVVKAQGTGYASAGASDESARGEQWMPLWSQPLTLAELRRLLSEGRARIGRKDVNEPLDMVRAVARLGAARGIKSFQRYGYIERNGQSNLAVPIGRVYVPDRISTRLFCLDDLDVWHQHLRREARSKGSPSRLQIVEKRLSDSIFAVTQQPNEAARWQSVLLNLAEVEAVLRTGAGFPAGPIPGLRPEWVAAADDGSTEIRLAVACALQWPSIRRHWLPLSEKGYRRFAASGSGGQQRLEKKPDVVMNGRSGVEDAIAVVGRRFVEIDGNEDRKPLLLAGKRASAYSADLGRLLAGEVDTDRVMALARALMAINRGQWAQKPCPPARPNSLIIWPDDAWLAIRLSLLPFPLPTADRVIPSDPAILRRLECGDPSSAVQLALQRLRAAGIRTTVRVATVSAQSSRLWAAALAFPISQTTASVFLSRLAPNSTKENTP